MASVASVSQRRALLVKAGADRHAEPLSVFGAQLFVKIATRDTDGAFAVLEGLTPPFSGPPLHCHRSQDEWWHVLEGQFRFEVDGESILAGPGDTVYAPRGSRHTFQNITAETGRTLVTVVPGGLDEFFRDTKELAAPGVKPDPAAFMPIFEKYDYELLGPPIAERKSKA